VTLKGSSEAASPVPEERWVKLLNNRLWGFRNTDPGVGALSGTGSALSLPADAAIKYVLFQHNIVMDSASGVSIAGPAAEHISVNANLFYDIRHNPSGQGAAIRDLAGAADEYYLNTIVGAQSYISTGPESAARDFRCNVMIDAGIHSGEWPADSQADYNAFYATAPLSMEQPSHDLVSPSAASAGNTPYCFHVRPWTEPQQVCVPDARSTTASPHYRRCDPDLGARLDVGVNDAHP
jgi:hypothetical protein